MKQLVFLIFCFCINSLQAKNYNLYATSQGNNSYKLTKDFLGRDAVFLAETKNCYEVVVNEEIVLDYDENEIDSKLIFKNKTCNISNLINLQNKNSNTNSSKNNATKDYNLFVNSRGSNNYILSRDKFGQDVVFLVQTKNCYEVAVHEKILFRYDIDNVASALIFNNGQSCVVSYTEKK